MFKDLKAFLMQDNVLNLAVAVIIGAAFGAIITSLVEDVLTPVIGLIFQAPDFSAIKLGPVGIGKFINAVVNFLIVGTSLFLVVKAAEKAQTLSNKAQADAEAAAGPTEVELLADIKALLEKQQG